MKVYLYILFSHSLQKYYAGISEDVQKRLHQHNSGMGQFTSTGVPWIFITVIECSSISDAMILDKKIKKRGIKRYMEDNGIV